MARIAKGAGVAHGTVYVYFGDKDDLLSALQRDVDAELQAAVAGMPAIVPGEACAAALSDWAEAVCDVFLRHSAVLQALAEALSDNGSTEAGRAALRSMQVSTGVMAARLSKARPASEAFDPEIAALCLFALIEGTNRAIWRGELGADLSAVGREVARFLQCGVVESPCETVPG